MKNSRICGVSILPSCLLGQKHFRVSFQRGGWLACLPSIFVCFFIVHVFNQSDCFACGLMSRNSPGLPVTVRQQNGFVIQYHDLYLVQRGKSNYLLHRFDSQISSSARLTALLPKSQESLTVICFWSPSHCLHRICGPVVPLVSVS